MDVSICIPAYNEEKSLPLFLQSLDEQSTHQVHIKEIVVVASGCTDRTVEIVKDFQSRMKNLKLLVQSKREGKAAAINAFLAQAQEEICVVSSADIILAAQTLEQLCLPFKEKDVGMTGARPVPRNNKTTFLGFAVHTLWQLHHEVALKNPKCGELIAFRKQFNAISTTTPVDEASIEALIKEQGLQVRYVPEAIVENKGPTTVRDFIQQRRRINYGHIWLKKKHQHTVSTLHTTTVLPLLLKKFSRNMKHNLWLVGLVLLELWSRFLARLDYTFSRKKYTLWKPIKSTKDL